MVTYTLWAGLPDDTMTAVGEYDDLSGECLTDAHEALRAGLAIMVKPGTTTREEYDAGDRAPDTSFLLRYAAAVLANSFMSPAERDWLVRQGLIAEVSRSEGERSLPDAEAKGSDLRPDFDWVQ